MHSISFPVNDHIFLFLVYFVVFFVVVKNSIFWLLSHGNWKSHSPTLQGLLIAFAGGVEGCCCLWHFHSSVANMHFCCIWSLKFLVPLSWRSASGLTKIYEILACRHKSLLHTVCVVLVQTRDWTCACSENEFLVTDCQGSPRRDFFDFFFGLKFSSECHQWSCFHWRGLKPRQLSVSVPRAPPDQPACTTPNF